MDWLRNYLISVVSVCMIAAIASVMIKDAMIGKVVKLVSGILILLVVISPLLKIDFANVSDSGVLNMDSEMIEQAQSQSHELFAEQIKQATQTHIEQIAARYGITVQAEVKVDDSDIPTPIEVDIIGVLQADQIVTLSEYIEQNIGISPNHQHWRSYEANS